VGIEQLGSARGLDALQEKIESAMSSSNKFNEFDVFMSSQLFMGQSYGVQFGACVVPVA